MSNHLDREKIKSEKSLRKLIRRISFAYFSILVISIAAIMYVEVKSHHALQQTEHKDFRNIISTAVAECHRVQNIRDRVNYGARISWIFFTDAINSNLLLYKQSHNAINYRIAHNYLLIRNLITYQFPTDCSNTVKYPFSYTAPPAISYRDAILSGAVRKPQIDVMP